MTSEVKVDKLSQKGSSGIVITDDIKLSSGKAIKNAAGTDLLTQAGVLGSSVVLPVGSLIGCACLVRAHDGTDGTSSTSRTLRNLDTVLYEIGFGVTIASNEWTFDDAGSYLIHSNAPAYNMSRHITTIYSDTGSDLVATGTAEYSYTGESVQTRSFIHTKVTITAAQVTSGGSEKSFGIYSQVGTAIASNGLGADSDVSTVEQHTQVQIFKIQE